VAECEFRGGTVTSTWREDLGGEAAVS
jgi:hypothetical protein